MKESVTSLQSADNWGHGAALQGIVEDVVSDLQRHHADTGVPLPHVAVDVPRDHKFDGNVAVLKELLSVWFRDAVRAAAGNAAMARTACSAFPQADSSSCHAPCCLFSCRR